MIRSDSIDAVKFWSRVDRKGADECWEWTGYRSRSGHGMLGGDNVFLTHRVAYALEHGVCDAPLLRHLCGNAPCCNPAHLAPGTHKENMRDKRKHGTWGNGVLTEESASRMVRLLKLGLRTKTIAKAFGCSTGHVYDVASGKSWAHVEPGIDRATLRRRKTLTPVG